MLTNNHVIENAEQIKIQTHDGKDYDVSVIARDPVYDLAFLKTKTSGPGSRFPRFPWATRTLSPPETWSLPWEIRSAWAIR